MADEPHHSAPFIPIWLDEFRLSPVAFRVLAHLWRRAGSKCECWPSVASIGALCGIRKPDTVHKALNELEAAGLMARESRAGVSNLYRLLIPQKGISHETGHPANQDASTPGGRDTGISRQTGYKGSKVEGSKRRDTQTCTAPTRGAVKDALFDALAAATDGPTEHLTESAARAVGVALAQIRKASPDLTVAEINRRAANYPTHYPKAPAPPSAFALAKNWARCREQGRAQAGHGGPLMR